MRTKILLVLTLLVYVTTGRAPGIREPRNPDAEHAGGRVALVMKRAWA
ncbi:MULTISPECIES: hypothetical protein [unclassified Methylobacterium]|nr:MULTISPECIES: hypothetical protein [unclassified Methylobacterium]MCJ2017501.1 hypothetical protein [Methylobacterium sp. E-065]MCJ2066019.1 hypothetical protein [Methylobacterium sp. J-088]